MAIKKSKFTLFLGAIDENKSREKAEETKNHIKRMAEMQLYVDTSEEKLSLLLEIIKPILHKGVIVYIELLDVVEAVKTLLNKEGINTLVITGKSTQKQRRDVSDTFMTNPHNTVVLFSAAGSLSIDLNSTNEIVLYNTPRGIKNYQQVLGRICRLGEFTSFNVHEVIVEETLDEYKQILLSSKKELEQTILNSDTIPLKHDVGSFDAQVLKKVRAMYLWKIGVRKRKPKI